MSAPDIAEHRGDGIEQADLPDSLAAENDADDEQPQDFPAAARRGATKRRGRRPHAGIGHD